MIKDFFKLFKPQFFKNNPYGFLTNQIAHLGFSFFLAYWLGDFFWAVAVFWVIWEVIHLICSRNLKDFIEDLFFELGGVVCIMYPILSWLFLASVIILTFIRLKKNVRL